VRFCGSNFHKLEKVNAAQEKGGGLENIQFIIFQFISSFAPYEFSDVNVRGIINAMLVAEFKLSGIGRAVPKNELRTHNHANG
jgi:hypothetical protein